MAKYSYANIDIGIKSTIRGDRCKINNLMKEKTSNSVFYILLGLQSLLTSLFFSNLLFFGSYPDFASAQSFFLILFSSKLCFSKIANYLRTFPNSKIVLDAHPVTFIAKLQFYCKILASSLIKR